MEKVFENIYRGGGWKAEGTVSGLGSTVRATEALREYFLKSNTFHAISICDAPCGDFNWMKLISGSFKNYIGLDIVKQMIDINNQQYGNSKTKFIHANICGFDFKSIDADIIFTRDCLVHLSLIDIVIALKNICNSNAKQLMMTHFTGNREFIEIQTGNWRPINFCKAPFNFPIPLLIVAEQCKEANGAFADKTMAIWDIVDIKKALQCVKI